MKFKVLLFYKYIKFPEPGRFQEEHLKFCEANDIKGRVWISDEGINATVSGTVENIEKYKSEIRKHPEFSDIWFKEDEHNEHAFRKIHVRLKKEIVNASFGEVDLSKTARRLKPEELNQFYESGKDFVIVDARNDYESVIGKFKNAIAPKMDTFRDWPKVVEELKEFKDKTIVTYCTGGIRCEKASALLVENGFKDVYQMDGGIWNYITQHPDKYWEGSVFVFDERRIVTPNTKEEIKHIGKCYYCGKPTSYYINCHNQDCDKMLLTCDECKVENDYCCSDECRHAPNRRKRVHG
ncbi:MAG: rhodanese-related sulfurtransferase [Bacteroidetes bacterium]|nr:rhodanese-related sulfurtransferase [Bacteroidota bacterium]MCL6098955.1 rhodanese-related sulfurtransferase [Bacteroidota bacterium]